jgi:hypothetical protein
MKKINLEWVSNLPEVGMPVVQAANDVVWQYEKAARMLADAKRMHKDFERGLLIHWTAEEIADTKRGIVIKMRPVNVPRHRHEWETVLSHGAAGQVARCKVCGKTETFTCES